MNSGFGRRVSLAAIALLFLAAGVAGAQAQSDAPPDSVAASAPSAPQVEMYPGTGALTKSRSIARAAPGEQGDITLNFVNTDVKDVAKAVLGDYLRLNYEIGANVQGTMTMRTSSPLTRSQVLPVLEQVLRLNDMAVVESDGIYKVVPLEMRHAKVARCAPAAPGSVRGYGIEIVPVHYITAAEMQKLLEPLAPAPGIVHADTVRNVLLIEGTEDERQTLQDDIALFDSDWLSGMSFAMFTPSHLDAQEMVSELDQVLGGTRAAALLAGPAGRDRPAERRARDLAAAALPGAVARLAEPPRPAGRGQRPALLRLSRPERTRRGPRVHAGKLLFGNAGTTPQAAPSMPVPFHFLARAAAAAEFQFRGAIPSLTPASDAVSISGSAPGIGDLSITADETNNALVILATPQQYGVHPRGAAETRHRPAAGAARGRHRRGHADRRSEIRRAVFFPAEHPEPDRAVGRGNRLRSRRSFPGFSYMLHPNGNNIKIILRRAATDHPCRGRVLAGGDGAEQPDRDAAGRRPRAHRHRSRRHADDLRRRADRQQHRIPGHRRDPEGDAARQSRRHGDDGHLAGGQRRPSDTTASRDPVADDPGAQDQQLGRGAGRRDGRAGRPHQRHAAVTTQERHSRICRTSRCSAICSATPATTRTGPNSWC